jgi:transposase
LVAVCKKYDVEYIDVLLNDVRMRALENDDVDGVTDIGYHCRIEFDAVTFRERSSSNKPFIPSLAEMKTGVVEYFREHRPELLECKFERFMQEKGHLILWTPPYSPDLQPIELFWAAGKNHAAKFYHNNTTMKEVVKYVREGWYGSINNDYNNENNNPNILPPTPVAATKNAVNCCKLFEESIKKANSIFVPLCEGISGTIGALTIDNNHVPNRQGMPIDMVVMDVTRDLVVEIEYGQ